MFGSIGGTELLVILFIALLIFGPRRLPELGRSIGRGLSEFKRASNELKRSLEEELTIDEKGPHDSDSQRHS
ncbi:MAG: twin-arginine translocase TatA/TatE family subunit [Acidobacteriota bacterium]